MAEASVQSAADGDTGVHIATLLGPPDWKELDGMLKELPPGLPILPREEAVNFAKYRHKPSHVYAKGEAWQKCAALMEKFDAELCKAHREEIDTLLVFAGLFSAVVTGFTVESYQWLQDDQNDAIVNLLTQIVHSVAPNGTSTPETVHASGMARSVSVRINAYWFVSLALSLATALVAILGKQWIREYERHAAMRPDVYVGVRQVKFEGFMYWKVGDIISSLPLLLQLSLALFALGVLELLWQLDTALGIAVVIPIALALLFYLTTTFLPLVHFAYPRPPGVWRFYVPPCAYKSPQALFIMQTYNLGAQAWRALVKTARAAYHQLSHWSCACLKKLGVSANRIPTPVPNREYHIKLWHSWAFWDKAFTDDLDVHNMVQAPSAYSRGLRWLVTDVDEPIIRELVWNCLWERVSDQNALAYNLSQLAPEFPFNDHFALDRDLTLRFALSLTMDIPRMDNGFRWEILVQTLREDVEPSTASQLLKAVRGHPGKSKHRSMCFKPNFLSFPQTEI